MFRMSYSPLQTIPCRIDKRFCFYAIIRKRNEANNLRWISHVNPCVCFSYQFGIIIKCILLKELVKVMVRTRKRFAVICEFSCEKTHNTIALHYKALLVINHFFDLGGNTKSRERLRNAEICASLSGDKRGVGSLPLRSASSIKAKAASPSKTGDEFIVIAIIYLL